MGGTGLIIVENACVDYPCGSNGTTQLRIDHDNYIPRLYKLVETIHKHNTKIAIQLNHAGASAVEAVSYTHLDVYKRQAYRRSCLLR